ncbi:sensor histidine kinase [Fredinandcohnia onubensis]|uniref:sensor histidine kinase n=1 Tax=Fredinandcohnia onubensis TaxID=1571209 RepID=UPI000C0BDA36|nr:histidine kinase [Fredinandcohnia onubensis]
MIKKSLHKKLLVIMLVAVIVPYVVSNIMTYHSSTEAIEDQLIENNRSLIESGILNISAYLEKLDQLSLTWLYDETLLQSLNTTNFSIPQRNQVEYEMKNLLYMNPDVMRIEYHSNTAGETFYTERLRFSSETNSTTPIEDRLKDTYRVMEVKEYEGVSTLIIHRKIVEPPNPEPLGYLTIYISTRELDLLLKRLSTDEEEIMLFLESKSVSSYSNTLEDTNQLQSIYKTEELQQFQSFTLGDEKGALFSETGNIGDVSLTLLKFIPSSMITGKATESIRNITFIQVIMLVLLAIMLYFVSLSIIQPIKRLIKNIASIEQGDFHIAQVVEPQREDELGQLEKRFVEMTNRLNQLITKELRLQIEMKTAQLKMLQAQINPHFLYNTLQSIGTIALKQNAPDVYERLLSLSSIFRYSMDLKTRTVPLKNEIQHTKEYLYLQTGRFKERLHYEVNCTEESLKVDVPKMILQPIVENSIIHGVEKGNRSVLVKIEGYTSEESLILRIVDNGQGFSQVKIEGIREQYANGQMQANSSSGIGLLNVLFRLHFEYGESFKWEIQSIPLKETTIQFVIPK